MPPRVPRRPRPHLRVPVGADYDIHHQDRFNVRHEAADVHVDVGRAHAPIVVGGEHEVVVRPRIRVRAEPQIEYEGEHGGHGRGPRRGGQGEPREHGEREPEAEHGEGQGAERAEQGQHEEHEQGAEHGEHAEHGEEHGHDLPPGVVDIEHQHAFPFDPSRMPYVEKEQVMGWALPGRLPLPSKLNGTSMASQIEKGISEDVRRAELGFEKAQAMADKLTNESRGIILPIVKDVVAVPLKTVFGMLSLIAPFRRFGPWSITEPFTDSNIAKKLKARKARADASEAFTTMQRIRGLKNFEEPLKQIAMAIDQARSPEERVAVFKAMRETLSEYHKVYGNAIAPRFKYYKGVHEGGKPMRPVTYMLPFKEYGLERRKLRLNESPEEKVAYLADRRERAERARRQAEEANNRNAAQRRAA
ncbi:MAG: hypothetical protein AABW72_00065 [archaeon]